MTKKEIETNLKAKAEKELEEEVLQDLDVEDPQNAKAILEQKNDKE